MRKKKKERNAIHLCGFSSAFSSLVVRVVALGGSIRPEQINK